MRRTGTNAGKDRPIMEEVSDSNDSESRPFSDGGARPFSDGGSPKNDAKAEISPDLIAANAKIVDLHKEK